MKKIVAAGLGLSILLSGAGSALPAFSNDVSGVVYAAKVEAPDIYSLYDQGPTNDANETFSYDFFYNGKEYREDVLEVDQNNNLRNQALDEVKKFREYAFDNIKYYDYNRDSGKVEYHTIGDWLILDSSENLSKEEYKESYINSTRWSDKLELHALQNAYKNYTEDTGYKNMTAKKFFEDYFYGKDENGKTIVDRYNDYQNDYVHQAFLDYYNDPNVDQIDKDHGSYSVYSFEDESFENLLTLRFQISEHFNPANVGFAIVSDGINSYLKFEAEPYMPGNPEPDEIIGKYKFHVGQKTDDSLSYEKTGQYHNLEVGSDYLLSKDIGYREDILYLDQSLELQQGIEKAIEAARSKAYDENLPIYGKYRKDVYDSKEISQRYYENVDVTDYDLDYIFAYENYASTVLGKEYYVSENRTPDGSLRMFGNGLAPVFLASKNKDLSPEDFINTILFEKRENGKSAFEMIKEGKDDPSLRSAIVLLLSDVKEYRITRFYSDDMVVYNLEYSYVYTENEADSKNMSGLKGSYKFEIGKDGIDDKEVEQAKKDLAKQVYDSIIQTSAAKMLLEKSPNTIAKIRPDLEKLVEENDQLILDSARIISGAEYSELKYSIVDIMRYKLDKKIASYPEKELVESMFDNIVASEAAKTLLENTPRTVKSIEKTLRKSVEDSENLEEEALKILK